MFTIIREFLQDDETYDPSESKIHILLTANRIASAYKPHEVMPAIRTVLEYLRDIVILSSYETEQVANQSKFDSWIATTINDLLTWLNNLDECGNIEIVYIDNYPIVVSTDARSVLDRQSREDSGGFHTSMLDIVTPVDAFKNDIMYIPDKESPQAMRWLKNLILSKTRFDRTGHDRNGKTMQDYLSDMLEEDVERFPLNRFWFVMDGTNKVVGIFGYVQGNDENGPYQLWGFGYPRKDVEGIPYYVLSLDCNSTSNCYTYAQQVLDQKGWKLVTGCSPAFNPYDPEYGGFWTLLDRAKIRVANPSQ
jgi:hypothetical protein